MQTDKHWKTVKMGSSDEICGVGCYAKKILRNVGNYIMGSGYDPSLSETISNSVDNQLKSRNVVLHTNESGDRRIVLHKMSEGDTQINWSLQEKVVFYRDDNKKLRRFDTDKN